MKHAFLSNLAVNRKQDCSSPPIEKIILERILAPRMDSPFMMRNLPRSIKEKLERPKSKSFFSV